MPKLPWLVWGILAAVLPTSIPFPTLYLVTPSFKHPHLCCTLLWEIPSHCPQKGFLRIKSKLLFLVYKFLYDLAFSSHQINLSFCSTIHQICVLYLECSSVWSLDVWFLVVIHIFILNFTNERQAFSVHWI